jgi:hypothetical protein
MRRASFLALVALVLVPAPAGAGTTRAPLALTATPARVALAGTASAIVRVTNPGTAPVVVDVGRAGFSLDLRGRPKVVARGGPRAAAAWLAVRPARFLLGAGATRALIVSSRLPRRVEPGDHDALVLLTTRPRRRGGVAVRMRLGIVVVVRAPGRVVRRLAIGGLRVRRVGAARVFELRVANLGNVTESLARGRVRIVLGHGDTRARVPSLARELRPRTSGFVELRYGGALRGWLTARLLVTSESGRTSLRRSFRIKL